jgi:hypothetical protein
MGINQGPTLASCSFISTIYVVVGDDNVVGEEQDDGEDIDALSFDCLSEESEEMNAH